jgi:hypothetical protein
MVGIFSLLQSRKFWLAVVALGIAGWQLYQGGIDVGTFIDAMIVVIGLLITAITAEDVAYKLRG